MQLQSAFKQLIVPLSIMTLAVLSGCDNGAGQDAGVDNRSAKGGVAIDGYLAYASVFEDVNENGVRESYEATALTDEYGYFSYNPVTQTNYCTSDNPQHAQFCFKTNSSASVLVVNGGTDRLTGSAFYGTMRSRLDPASGSINITPLSTLLSYVDTDVERDSLLTKLNVDKDFVNYDYFNQSLSTAELNAQSDANKTKAIHIMSITQKIHKSVAALSQSLDKAYNIDTNSDKVGKDTTLAVYQQFSQEMQKSANLNLNDVTTNINLLTQIVSSAQSFIDLRYRSAGLFPPSINNPVASEVFANTSKISQVVDELVKKYSPGTAITMDNSKGVLKSIELITQKIAKNASISEIDDVVTFMQNPINRNELITELDKPQVHVTSLENVDIANTSQRQAVTNAEFDPIFASLAGKKLVATNIDSPNIDITRRQDMRGVLYFEDFSNAQESSEVTAGNLTACVRYVDGRKADGNLKDQGTLGTLADIGTWQIINSGYGLSMVVDYSGIRESGTLLYNGMNSNQEHRFTIQIAGQTQHFVSTQAPVAMSDNEVVPTTRAACKMLLDSVTE